MKQRQQEVRRLRALARLDFTWIIRRAPIWVWIGCIALFTFVVIQSGTDLNHSGDSAAGGRRAFVTSVYSIAGDCAFLSILLSTFFASIIAGLTPIRDDEARIGSILHATPLTVGEYVWGKIAGILGACGLVVILHVVLLMVFYNVLPLPGVSAWRGPFHISNYLLPALVFTLPYTIFLVCFSFAIGSAFRQPILIFVLPFAIITGFFLYNAISDSVSPGMTRVLGLFEPSGFVWFRTMYLTVDRGVDFYNKAPLILTPAFVISRVAIVLVSLGLVWLSQLHLTKVLKNPAPAHVGRKQRREMEEAARAKSLAEAARRSGASAANRAAIESLSNLRMRGGRPGLWRSAFAIAVAELDALRRQPGLYLFLPLIVFFCAVSADQKTGMFSTERMWTAGYLAASQFDIVAIFVGMLLLAYTVETLERDRACGLTALEYALPVRTASLLIGKFLALCVVAVLPLAATAGFLLLSIAGQHTGAPLTLQPFFLLWGVMLGPSLGFWIAFVMALYVVSGHSRYQTYSWGALLLILISLGNKAGWVFNIFLVSAFRWSDLAPLELDRVALWLSRLAALALALFFGALACRLFRRRDFDTAGRASRRNLRAIFWTGLPLLPLALIPIVLLVQLQTDVDAGESGADADRDAKNYWKRNSATWQEIPMPGLTNVALSVDLFPAKRTYTERGVLTLANYHAFPLTTFAITPTLRARNVQWTLGGKPYVPDNRAGLYVFTPPAGSFGPEKSVTVGFAYDVPNPGPTKAGVGNVDDSSGMEFVTPSSVVLTSFSSRLLPEIGYDGGIGVDEDNKSDDADPTITNPLRERGEALFGSATPFALHLTVTSPKDFQINSVGTHVSQVVAGDRRTDVWDNRLDPAAPVRDFNIVGGRNLTTRTGANGTSLYYYPGHRYNIAEMTRALESARTWYGTWFAPYPWKELKLTEFPDYAGYAQSFPTNISFGEGMGFLTRSQSDENADATDAFAVTAHESAHQWWGNLVVPGDGGGSNVLSEGLAHFSAALLLEQVKGVDARKQFLREIEWEYNRTRSVDSELPLAHMTGGKSGDQSVTYDKGGWVFTMLSEQVMGRANMLRGLRAYVSKYRFGSYHPGIPDLLATLRPFAPDKAAFDKFTNQWFYQVVMPEFTVANLKTVQTNVKARNGKLQWDTNFELSNTGSGLVATPVTIYGPNGETTPFKVPLDGTATKPTPVYCRLVYKPVKIIIDPDVTILQRNRNTAFANF